MKALRIKKLERHPEQLRLLLEQNEFLLITTQQEQPLGMLIPFSSHLVEQSLVDWLAIKAFESGDLTLGQLAKALNKTKSEMLDTLDKLSISIADYDLAEDLDTIENLMT
jgi:predicted HTH domain antitoxin